MTSTSQMTQNLGKLWSRTARSESNRPKLCGVQLLLQLCADLQPACTALLLRSHQEQMKGMWNQQNLFDPKKQQKQQQQFLMPLLLLVVLDTERKGIEC